MTRRTLLIVGGLATIYLVWGSTYLGIALAIETMPPLTMAAARFVLAGAILYLLAGGARLRPSRSDWTFALVTGGLLLAVGNGGVSWAQQTVASGIAALVIATIPLWIALLDRLLFGARLSPLTLAGIAVGFAGVAILLDPRGAVDATGGAVLLVAAAGWSLGTLLTRGRALGLPPLAAAGMQMLCGGTILLLAAAVGGEFGAVRLSEVSATSVAALAYLVLFGSLLAFSAYVWLVRNASVSLVSTYAYVNPVVAVLLGSAFLGEEVTARTLVAGGIVVAAVALIVSARAPAPLRRPARLAPVRGR
ncbi:MAG: EamA family transporter [Actinomycetota bacterium]|nr:EamA family transporter [Actinomycetota bacterium]